MTSDDSRVERPRTARNSSFAQRIVSWQRAHGRNDLPWQNTRDAYRIWLSEIMLQQTQVTTVLPYYERFLLRFPDVQALAAASEDDVLAHWAGLGYYSRARNLHRAAQQVVAQHGGHFPLDVASLAALPGIGRSTAAAIAAFAHDVIAPILDGNVKRVLTRHAAIAGFPGLTAVERALWDIAAARLPRRGSDMVAYTQGLMDLGATLCVTAAPRCAECPVRSDCRALAEGLTAQLPTPRPRKALPEREQRYLLLRHGNDVLLVKRPAPGIWGGLWCLPELTADDDALAIARQYGARRAQQHGELTPVEHTFTHFRLTMRIVDVIATGKQFGSSPAGSMWLPVSDAASAALPKPVATLLRAPAGSQ